MKITVPATTSVGSRFTFSVDYLGKEAFPKIGYGGFDLVKPTSYPFIETPTGRVVSIMVATDSSVNPLSFSTPGTIDADYVATATGVFTFMDSSKTLGDPGTASIIVTDR